MRSTKLKIPPYRYVSLCFETESDELLTEGEKEAFVSCWEEMWPLFRAVIEELFSMYDSENLFKKEKANVLVAKLKPNKKINYGATRFISFSFAEDGISWDIFLKDRKIVHAQPVF